MEVERMHLAGLSARNALSQDSCPAGWTLEPWPAHRQLGCPCSRGPVLPAGLQKQIVPQGLADTSLTAQVGCCSPQVQPLPTRG